MEQTYTLYVARDYSWRGPRLTRPARLAALALILLGGWASFHGAATSAAAKSRAPLRPRSRTAVLVLNGNGLPGAASDMSTRILNHGYRSAFAKDAQVMTYGRSLVLFRPGWRREAARLAKDAGIRGVAPLDGRHSRYPLVAIVGH